MKPLFFITIFFKLCGFILAQDTKITIGPRSHALAGSTLTTNDSPSVFNFPASGAVAENSQAYFGYRNHFNLRELQLIYAGFTYNINHFNAGVSILRFGDDLYNSNRISIICSHQINAFSLGIKLRRDEMFISDLDAVSAYSADLSGIYKISESLMIGMAMTNITQSQFKNHVTVPSIMTLGLNYRFANGIMLIGEFEQEVGRTSLIKTAFEYSPAGWFLIQTGIQPLSQTWSCGFTLNYKAFSLQYGMQSSSRIGTSNDIAVLYKIRSGQ